MRVGLIGTGAIAALHARAYKNIGFTIRICSSRTAETGRRFADQHGAEFAGHYETVCRHPDVDFVLVMSVNPGFGGQTFIPRSDHKVRAVRDMLDRAGNGAPVEIDGGIDLSNVGRVVEAGAEIIVAGSAIFNTADPAAATRALKQAASAVLR